MTAERFEQGRTPEIKVNPHPGLFVDIEGLDGCGSTTQLYRLVEALQQRGLTVESTFEPSDGHIGNFIRHILERKFVVDRTAFQVLFVADRIDHLERWIAPRLASGISVISDRCLWSTLAYAECQDRNYVYGVHQHPKIFLPDLTIFLDVPLEVCLERIALSRKTRDIFEEREELQRAFEGYQRAFSLPLGHTQTVDGVGLPEEVTMRIMAQLEGLAKFCSLREGTSP